jgi:hypothetical protein
MQAPAGNPMLPVRVFITGKIKLSEVTDKQDREDNQDISDQIQIF